MGGQCSIVPNQEPDVQLIMFPGAGAEDDHHHHHHQQQQQQRRRKHKSPQSSMTTAIQQSLPIYGYPGYPVITGYPATTKPIIANSYQQMTSMPPLLGFPSPIQIPFGVSPAGYPLTLPSYPGAPILSPAPVTSKEFCPPDFYESMLKIMMKMNNNTKNNREISPSQYQLLDVSNSEHSEKNNRKCKKQKHRTFCRSYGQSHQLTFTSTTDDNPKRLLKGQETTLSIDFSPRKHHYHFHQHKKRHSSKELAEKIKKLLFAQDLETNKELEEKVAKNAFEPNFSNTQKLKSRGSKFHFRFLPELNIKSSMKKANQIANIESQIKSSKVTPQPVLVSVDHDESLRQEVVKNRTMEPLNNSLFKKLPMKILGQKMGHPEKSSKLILPPTTAQPQILSKNHQCDSESLKECSTKKNQTVQDSKKFLIKNSPEKIMDQSSKGGLHFSSSQVVPKKLQPQHPLPIYGYSGGYPVVSGYSHKNEENKICDQKISDHWVSSQSNKVCGHLKTKNLNFNEALQKKIYNQNQSLSSSSDDTTDLQHQDSLITNPNNSSSNKSSHESGKKNRLEKLKASLREFFNKMPPLHSNNIKKFQNKN